MAALAAMALTAAGCGCGGGDGDAPPAPPPNAREDRRLGHAPDPCDHGPGQAAGRHARGIERAYFYGCGHPGYAKAQRYPEDFDGIIAGARNPRTGEQVYPGWPKTSEALFTVGGSPAPSQSS